MSWPAEPPTSAVSKVASTTNTTKRRADVDRSQGLALLGDEGSWPYEQGRDKHGQQPVDEERQHAAFPSPRPPPTPREAARADFLG